MDSTALVVPGFIAIVALVVVLRSLVRVPDGSVYVVERLGRFARLLHPGVHLSVPLIDRVAAKIPTGDQTLEIPPASATTRDGTSARVSGSVTFRVTDAALAVYKVANFREALVQLTSNLWLRAVTSVDESEGAAEIGRVESAIRKTTAEWGVAIVQLAPKLTTGLANPFDSGDRFRRPGA